MSKNISEKDIISMINKYFSEHSNEDLLQIMEEESQEIELIEKETIRWLDKNKPEIQNTIPEVRYTTTTIIDDNSKGCAWSSLKDEDEHQQNPISESVRGSILRAA